MPDKAPAFQFYPDKWLAGTGHLSPEAYLAYHRLLCWLWLHGKNHCSMKDTTEMWKRATGMNGNSLTSAKKEIMSPDFSLLRKRGVNVFSKGLQKESEKQRKRSQQSKDAIKARWDRELGRYGRNTGVLRPLYPPSLTTYNKRIMSDAIEKHGADAVNLSVLLGSYIYRNHDKPNVKPYDWLEHSLSNILPSKLGYYAYFNDGNHEGFALFQLLEENNNLYGGEPTYRNHGTHLTEVHDWSMYVGRTFSYTNRRFNPENATYLPKGETYEEENVLMTFRHDNLEGTLDHLRQTNAVVKQPPLYEFEGERITSGPER